MVYVAHSQEVKERAITLLDNGWPLELIVEALGVSKESIARWDANNDRYGSVSAPRLPTGRPRILNAEIILELRQLLAETPSIYYDEMLDYLSVMHGERLSLGALHNNIEDLGLTRKLMQKVAAQQDKGLQDAWKNAVLPRYTAEQMVFVDESSKDGRTIARRYGWAERGKRPAEFFEHDRGERYSILPALTVDGYIALRVVPGSVDGEEMFDFIVNDLLPEMNAFPQPRSVLILDNCNIHKSDAIRTAVEANGSLLIFLPPYSPELNPIEESFSAVKKYLRRHWRELEYHPFPELALFQACMAAVNAENAPGWFRHSGYL